MFRNVIFTILLALVFGGCYLKQENIENSYPIKLIVKSPNIKMSGLGFYKQGGNYINVQIFSGGSVSLNYESSGPICINIKCMTRGFFNENFFLYSHYETFIDDILAGRPIYSSQNLIENESGFSQKIVGKDVSLIYEVSNGDISFGDTKNRVFINLTRLEK